MRPVCVRWSEGQRLADGSLHEDPGASSVLGPELVSEDNLLAAAAFTATAASLVVVVASLPQAAGHPAHAFKALEMPAKRLSRRLEVLGGEQRPQPDNGGKERRSAVAAEERGEADRPRKGRVRVGRLKRPQIGQGRKRASEGFL
jgi:hypothetical protein